MRYLSSLADLQKDKKISGAGCGSKNMKKNNVQDVGPQNWRKTQMCRTWARSLPPTRDRLGSLAHDNHRNLTINGERSFTVKKLTPVTALNRSSPRIPPVTVTVTSVAASLPCGKQQYIFTEKRSRAPDKQMKTVPKTDETRFKNKRQIIKTNEHFNDTYVKIKGNQWQIMKVYETSINNSMKINGHQWKPS